MTKTLISERPKLIPIYEFQHHSKMVKNRAYAINLVDKAISRAETTIQLDKTKLECKVYTGTSCYMFNRLGEPMIIKEKDFNSLVDIVIQGYSNPQHEDKFNRYEGRMNALKNACSNIQLVKSDPNFDDLLAVKRFINTFELEVNCSTISYQFMDLWLAILSNNEESIKEAAINYVGLEAYNKSFSNSLMEFNDAIKEFEVNQELSLNSVSQYELFKNFVKLYNPSLF